MTRAVITTALAITCMADAFKFCAPINVFGGDAEHVRVGKCLYEHKTALQPDCQEAMKKWTPQKAGKR